MFDTFDASLDLVALAVSAPPPPAPSPPVLQPTGITLFSMRSHENALAYKPPIMRKESSKFEAPKLDPLALPSVGMEARLQQVLELLRALFAAEIQQLPDVSAWSDV